MPQLAQLTNENVETILGRVLLAEQMAVVAVTTLCVYAGEQANDASVGDTLLSDIKQMILNGIDGYDVTTDLSVVNIKIAARRGYENSLARVTISSSD